MKPRKMKRNPEKSPREELKSFFRFTFNGKHSTATHNERTGLPILVRRVHLPLNHSGNLMYQLISRSFLMNATNHSVCLFSFNECVWLKIVSAKEGYILD